MLSWIKSLPAINQLSKSFTKKLMTITLLGLLVGFILSLSISNHGLNFLKNDSIKDIEIQSHESNQMILKSYLQSNSELIELKINALINEQSLLREITQVYFDKQLTNAYIGPTRDQYDLTDALQDNGRYLQNAEDQQSVILIQNYLLNEDRTPDDETKKMITKTVFLNTLLMPFHDFGVPKTNVYFTGKKEAGLYRLAPWTDLGKAFEKNYPKDSNASSWDLFYPGLLNLWEEQVSQNKNEMNSDSLLFMSPSQDAATGQVAISVKSAIWNKERNKIEGTISYDVSLDMILKQIESLKISENSFAFLSESNGNLLAINELGANLLDLPKDLVTVKSDNGAFNVLKRTFKDSQNSAVQAITLSQNENISIQELQIENKDYWLITRQLAPFKSWNADKGIFDERWTLGFIVPVSDFIAPFENIKSSIEQNANVILLKQAAVTLMLFAFIATIVFLIFDKMTTNLNLLIEATQHIKKRHFDVLIDIDTEDEFGTLAESFNDMTAEIQATVQQLTAQNELLKDEMGLKERMDEQISFMKQYDTLTALPNKQTLYKKIDEYIRRSTHEQHLGALVVIGLDNFKRINEAYGVETGDELLIEVAERLRNAANADSISRITGDEFGLIFYGLKALDDLIPRLDYLRFMLNKPFEINSNSIYLTASYGISTFPGDAMSSKEILKNAATALVNAKENRSDHYRFYDSSIEQNIKNKVDLMNALRKSIELNELSLVYQPITDAATGQMVSVEALLRWHSKAFGYIPPSIFVPLAEEIHFITDIERFVIQQVMKDIEIMTANQMGHVYVSINLSAIDLDSDEFMDYLENQIKLNHIAFDRIQLEITEGVLINRYDRLVPRLSKLAKAGIHIALDDFGTGYSSLKYIKRLPIDCLKIDRSFVKDYPDYDDGGIAKIIVALAKTFNMNVIAEGVETVKQAEFLKEAGCHLHQGYLYGKGITISQLISSYQYDQDYNNI